MGPVEVVLILKVEVMGGVVVLTTEVGLNVAVAPTGAGDVKVRLRGDVQEVPFPLKVRVAVYAAVLPGATETLFGLKLRTFGIASVNVFCA
jgi:hypothetical protein